MTDRGERTYGGLSPHDRRQARRRRVLDAALELYGTQGFASTTITDLCRAAGIASAKFYEEFADQENVVFELAQEIGLHAIGRVFEAIDGEPDDLAHIARVGLQAFAHSLLDDPRRARVMLVEVVGVSAGVEARRRELLGGWATLLIHRFWSTAEGSGRRMAGETATERLIATAMVGAVNEAMVAWLRHPDGLDIDELVDALTGLLVTVGTWVAGAADEQPGGG